jgi:hypothetical protein
MVSDLSKLTKGTIIPGSESRIFPGFIVKPNSMFTHKIDLCLIAKSLICNTNKTEEDRDFTQL